MQQVFRRDAASGITDRHGHVIIAALGADLDFASLRVADGIDDEVANDALNLCAINLDLWEIIRRVNMQLQTLCLYLRAQLFCNRSDQVTRADRGESGRTFTRLDLREVEKVSHQLIEPLTILTASLKHLLLFIGQLSDRAF